MSLLSNQSVSSRRILVVDDDPGVRDLLVASLRADGHDVDPTSNGLGRQWYDLIVSDLKMPELDGPSLSMRRWPTELPHVLFVSEYTGFLKVIKAPVLAKPFKAGDLGRTAWRML